MKMMIIIVKHLNYLLGICVETFFGLIGYKSSFLYTVFLDFKDYLTGNPGAVPFITFK